MSKLLWGIAAGIVVGCDVLTAGTSFREAPEKYWNFTELSKPPEYKDAAFADSKVVGLRDVLVKGVDFNGKSADFFAYIGFPEGKVPPGGFPGIVMVHGGGGTAFARYVKMWNKRGFAVIAPDWYNQRPVMSGANDIPVGQIALEGGKRQNHVNNVGNIVLAHSLLRSLKNVNPNKTALVGLSWGSWYGAMASAVDNRFKGTVEIYCGDVNRSSKSFINGRFHHAAKVPMYWVAGTNDQNVTPKTLQAGFDECPGLENKSLVIRLPHSHIGFEFDSCFRMAEHFTGGTPGLPGLSNATVSGKTISSKVVSPGKGITHAILAYTLDRDEKVSHKRKWESIPAKFDGKTVSATLPDGVFQCFLSAYDGKGRFNDLCGSSNVVEIKQYME